MNGKRAFFWVATLLVVFIFQMFCSDFLAVFGVFPNCLLLATLYFGVTGGPVVGEWTGFIWGLFADVASISTFGSQTFMMTLAGYLAGRLRGQIDEDKPIAQMGLVLVMSVFFLLGLVFFESLFGGGTGQRFKFSDSIFQPVYSTLVSPVFFWLLARWCARYRR